MKRITPPAAQQSLFGSDSAPAAVLPTPKTPRARAVAKPPAAAASITAETEAKIAKTKIAKTNSAPPPVSNASPEKMTPVKATPKSAPLIKETAPVKTPASLKAVPVPKTAPVKPAIATKAVATAKANAPVKAAVPIKVTPVKTADRGVKQKIAKTNSQPKKSAPAATAVRVVNEPVFEGGMLWKMSGRNGVAYIKDAALAGELLAIDPKKLAQAAMAVYYDKKGKAFAWQVRFDTDRWDEVMKRLG